MRQADEKLVRAHITETTRAMAQTICRKTRERRWELFRRLMRAELARLEAEAAPGAGEPETDQ